MAGQSTSTRDARGELLSLSRFRLRLMEATTRRSRSIAASTFSGCFHLCDPPFVEPLSVAQSYEIRTTAVPSMEEHDDGTRIHYRIGGRPRENGSGVAHRARA